MLDQMLLGEATTNSELQEYLEEYDRDWYIGLEKDPEWTAAILESRQNLFSLGHNNTQVGRYDIDLLKFEFKSCSLMYSADKIIS